MRGTHKRGTILLAALGVVLGVALAHGASAQGLDLSSGGDALPITIDAGGGIEWNQETHVFIAAGPATATQGDMVLDADELRAYYRDAASGNSEIYRLDAIGNVRITTPGRVATGGHAVYDVDKSVMVLKDGDPVKMVSGGDVIIAKGQLEFWELRGLAVARGGAQAARADKRIRADVLTAHFKKDRSGKSQIELIEAFDNVRIDTATEQVFSNRGAYNVPTGLARLTGSVRIVQGGNQINGCSADIDLNTGISRLNSCEGAGVTGATQAPGANATGQTGGSAGTGLGTTNSGRVRGVLVPKGK